MRFLRALALLLALSGTRESLAQITCDFTFDNTGLLCAPYLIRAPANETSSFPVTQRTWTLTFNAVQIDMQTGNTTPYVYIGVNAGVYCLTLQSQNLNGDVCTITKCITVAASPVIDFTFSPTEGCRGLCVDAICNSTPGGGVINSVQIDWGCVPITTLPNCPSTPIRYCYNNCSPRLYDPVVIVSNSLGCVSSHTYNDAINIIPPPTVCISADTTTANCTSAPLPVNFTACNAGANMTYCWYINDTLQQCNTSRNFSHTFPINNVDCYDIKLVVRHASGCADSVTMTDYICVRQAPQLCITPLNSSCCIAPGESCNLTLNNCTPGLTNVQWSLSGGNGGGFGPSETWTLSALGNYTVTVTGTFGPGCTATLTQTVDTLKAKPVASFTVNDPYSCLRPHTIINTAVPCTGCLYTWNNPGGSPALITNSPTPSETVTYVNFGNFSSTLTVTAPNGCTQSQTQTGYVLVGQLNPVIQIQNQIAGCAPVCPTFNDITTYTDPISSQAWVFNPPDTSGTGSTFSPCFTDPGCYDVSLIVTSTTGCVDTARLDSAICIGIPPVCTVQAVPPVMCFEDSAVCFYMTCNPPFDTAFVDWGDGETAIAHTNPFCHFYVDIGTFTVTIIPYRDSCPGPQITTQVTINAPISRFTDSSTCLTGDTVFFTNQSVLATSYKWYFCNGDSSTLSEPFVILPPCDTCRVILETFNSTTGCRHRVERLINTACDQASFTPVNTIACVNRNTHTLGVTWTSTSASSLPGWPRWDPDITGGPVFGFPGPTFTWINYAPGNYVMAMKNITTSGCIDTVYGNVTACEVTADFASNNVCFPDSICFTSQITDAFCTVDTIRWDFGDSTGFVYGVLNPCHKYDSSGIYVATLYVTNDIGCWDTSQHTVIVSQVVDISYDIDTVICPGTNHCITNTSTGVALTYVWEIPSDTPYDTFSATGPCYQIALAGDYWIYVNVSSGGLCTTRDSVLVHNCPPLASGFISDTFVPCPNPPQLITFTSTSTCIDSIFWSFGDEATSDDPDVSHYYEHPGVYPICLRVTTTDGCADSVCIDTIIVEGPFGNLTVDPPGMCACKDTIDFTVCTWNSSSMTLLYGCTQGSFTVSPIIPIGTTANPTCVTTSYSFPSCLTDSCLTQVIFGDDTGCFVYLNQWIYIDSPVVNFSFNSFGACITGSVCFQDLTTYDLPSFRSWTASRLWNFGDGTTDTAQNPCHIFPGAGTYTVRLTIFSNLGCVDSTVTQTVIIPQFPEAGYYADDSIVCAFTQVCFHDTSIADTLTGISYSTWDFGDNSPLVTTTLKDTCHTYTTGGSYRVILCVYDSLGCPDCDSSIVVQVIDNPVANAGPDDTVCYDIIYTLNGTGAANCFWSPTGLISDSAVCNPTVQLQSDNSFQLIVSDQYGCSDTDNVALTVSRVISDFNVSATSCLIDSVCVTDASTVINASIVSWTYDFGDGTPVVSGANVCHKYATPGTYDILQTVTDNQGCIDTTVKSITIFPNPVAAFTIVDPVICRNEPVCVTDASTGLPPLSYDWNFDVGVHDTGSNPPCRLYPPNPPPTYTITLIVTDVNGCIDSTNNIVTVNEIPLANFNWLPSCENVPMQLSSSSTPGDGAINNYNWTWIDPPPASMGGNTSNITYLFPTGTHQVQLIVTDVNGCADTIVKTVQTDALTNVSITGGDTTICIGSDVSYSVTGSVTSVTWSPNIWIDDYLATTVLVTPLANITYMVSSVNGACAPATDTVSIFVLDTVPVTVTAVPQRIIIGLSSNITSQIPAPIDSIIWVPDTTLSCRDCRNPVATPRETTTYYAYVYYSLNGVTCSTMDSVTIEVINSCDESIVYLPNTFTPNSDGLNDVFMIRGIGVTKINYLRIFDRWGKLMKEVSDGLPNDPRWGWDGNDNQNKKLDPAVFVYTYEIECINRDIVSNKGNVTLVR